MQPLPEASFRKRGPKSFAADLVQRLAGPFDSLTLSNLLFSFSSHSARIRRVEPPEKMLIPAFRRTDPGARPPPFFFGYVPPLIPLSLP